MPMIRITTRSSIRVKPFSLSARRRSFESMDPPGIGEWVSPDPLGPRHPWLSNLQALGGSPASSNQKVRGFASRPHGRFALGTYGSGRRVIGLLRAVLDVCWTLV